ncbi:MAG TPA: ROK family protein [Blastocatellia bacterium]|jgi:glucokinase|nr:ROK family protein [Blastocatellia bacterium]
MGPYILGIDLGGTKVMAGVLDGEGKIVSRARAKTRAWRGDEAVFQTVAQTARRAIEVAGIGPSRIAALGIGAPGPLDPGTGYIIESSNMKFKDFPMGPRLSDEFGCRSILDNDVNAGIYGEFRAGAARGARDVLGLFVGTGIGGGLIINGALYHGFSKNAGEVGHIIIEAGGGPRCGCGNRGCLESLASRTAMTRDIRKAIRRGDKTSVSKLLKKETDVLSGGDLKKAYDAGDELVSRIVHRAAKLIGVGIGGLVNVLAPEMVVLGGGVVEAMGDDFIRRIDRSARKVAVDFATKDLKIVRAELGDDAGVIGAAMLARGVAH